MKTSIAYYHIDNKTLEKTVHISTLSNAGKKHLEKTHKDDLDLLDTLEEKENFLNNKLANAHNENEFNIIQNDTINQDMYFYKGLTLGVDKKSLDYDMNICRDIHMNKIRELRDEKLKVLDIETFKGNDVQVEKQVLRDIPNTFDLTIAKDIVELKDLIPMELKIK